MVCWATTLCSLIGDYQHCAGSYHPHLHLYLEHEGNMVLWNTSNHSPEKHTVNVDMKLGISGFNVVGFGSQCSHYIQGECEVQGIDWFTGFTLGVRIWMYNAVWSNGEELLIYEDRLKRWSHTSEDSSHLRHITSLGVNFWRFQKGVQCFHHPCEMLGTTQPVTQHYTWNASKFQQHRCGNAIWQWHFYSS